MKIATWNVNGLRSVVRRDFETWLTETGYDVICLQEVKVEEDLLTTHWFEGYEAYWNPSRRAGHSGVATLVRRDLKAKGVVRGIGDTASDPEGRVITLDVDGVRIVNVYAPHSHRKLTRLEAKLSFLARFSDFVRNECEDNSSITLLGDFNIAHREIDLANPKSNRGNAGFLPEERAWVDRLLDEGFHDAFRDLHPEPGHYTWWSMIGDVRARNVGWRLDYAFVSAALRPRLQACDILSARDGSDHCPVVVTLARD